LLTACGLNRRIRKALVAIVPEESAMAAAAKMGLSNILNPMLNRLPCHKPDLFVYESLHYSTF
jgi:hypothetical protein